jgi:hypothetical protein
MWRCRYGGHRHRLNLPWVGGKMMMPRNQRKNCIRKIQMKYMVSMVRNNTTPSKIHWSNSHIKMPCHHYREIKNRYHSMRG